MNKIRRFSLMALLPAMTTLLLSILSLAGLSLTGEPLALAYSYCKAEQTESETETSETDPEDE